MNGIALGLRKERKRKKEKGSSAQPLWRKFPGEPRKGLDQDTLGLPKS